ncbi:MAG: hypothetical protein MUF05_01945 [Candidatus Omnitrophica bacterium]|jgi:predicted transcriptional regulator of viral defense system|nr:hypothetical protein [Candidatus Omnitrophota bacterium]
MHYLQLSKLNKKPYFDIGQIADTLGITKPSARVIASRYVKQGILIRLKNNCYVTSERWQALDSMALFSLANILQVPSYISFLSALGFHEISTQVARGVIESVSLKRSRSIRVKEQEFVYYKLRKKHYFGFHKKDGIFMATAEKALADACYLYSLNRYALDFSALNLSRLNKRELSGVIRHYPKRTQQIVKKICKI